MLGCFETSTLRQCLLSTGALRVCDEGQYFWQAKQQAVLSVVACSVLAATGIRR